MHEATAQALAEGYAAFFTTGDLGFLSMFSPDFYDNVHTFRFADGLVVEHRAVRDDLALLESAKA